MTRLFAAQGGQGRRRRAFIEGDGWDAAWAALYFASDESRFVTAQSLVVDAGVASVLGFVQVMRTRT